LINIFFELFKRTPPVHRTQQDDSTKQGNRLVNYLEQYMKGSVLDFSIQTNTGIISGDDQNRYTFIGSEWKESTSPQRGMKIDFDLDAAGQAIAVYKALGTAHTSNPSFNISEKDEDQYHPLDWVKKNLKNYANFNGRARRKELWFFYLWVIVFNSIVFMIDASLGAGGILFTLTYFGLVIPQFAVSARRLHDIGKSGWWYLISLTGIGLILLIIWWAKEGDTESNQYGEPAK
jgi:uncharacterized membrane protein YhaH (DUF805 family)